MANYTTDFKVKHGLVVSTTATILSSTSATSTTTGALIVSGGTGIGQDLWVGGSIYSANERILTAADLATVTHTATYITNNPATVAVAGTSTTYGTYNFGAVGDIGTFNDYNTGTNTGYYSINDTVTTPGYVVYAGFSGITDFNRIVLNLNYTQSSGHTVDIDLYNYQTANWDTFAVYSGSAGWTQFALGLIDEVTYISSGTVTLRIYHVSTGNASHRTWIDYIALEKSITGGQGPRGVTGATGATGPQGVNTGTSNIFTISNVTQAYSTQTGALQVYGGAGFGGDLYVGGNIYGNVVGSGSVSTATNLAGGTAGQVPYQTAPGTTSFYGPGTAGNVLISNGTGAPSYNNTLTLTGTTNASSTNTGALQVVGGVGIGGGLVVGNTSTFVGGNVGIGTSLPQRKLQVTGYTDDTVILVQTTAASFAFIGFADLASTDQTGQTARVGSNGNNLVFQTVGSTDRVRISSVGIVTISASTNSNSTTTGALQIVGGLGAGGGGYFGGVVTATSFVGALTGDVTGNLTGTATTATNLAGGLANQYPYQTAPGITAFISTGSIYVGNAVTATNLASGTTGAIAYQTNPGATTFLTLSGTAKSLLTAGASAPVYVTQVQAQSGTGSASAATGQSLVVTGGGLGVTGDSYFGDNVGINSALNVNSTVSNTGTALSNALYVAGGTWINKTLVVNGATLFKDAVTFSGTATYVLSTNTFYTDNLIDLHTPPTGVTSPWFLDDGKDIGFRFHYYTNSTDTNAALVLDNTTKELHWYSSGVEDTSGNFSTATYGTFATGIIKAVSGNQNAGNTNTGALQVLGGAGIAGSLFVSGAVTATTFFGAVTGVATTSTNLAGGLSGSLPYQTAAGSTSMLSIGTNGYVLTSNGSAPVWSAVSGLSAGLATTATNLAGGTAGQFAYQTAPGLTSFASTGSMYVGGAVSSEKWSTARTVTFSGGDVTGSFSIDGSANVTGVALTVAADSVSLGTDTTGVYVAQGATAGFGLSGSANAESATFTVSANSTSSNTTNSIVYRDGSGNFSAGTITAALTGNAQSATSATNISGGAAGSIPYNFGFGQTTFLAIGTSGYVLTAGASAPQWTAISGLSAGLATTATNIAGGTAGQLNYQSSTGTTSFAGPGTAGQLLVSAGTSAPTYTNTASIGVGFVSNLHTAGTGLTGTAYNGSVAQTWTLNTATLMASAVTALSVPAANITGQLALTNGGTAANLSAVNGGIVYSGASALAISAAGTLGQVLISGGAGAPTWASTTTLYVARAVLADSATGAAGSVTNALTIGTGLSGTVGTYNGSAAVTISLNTATYMASSVSAGTASNLSGGAAGSMPYQTSGGATSMLALGTNGYVLTAGASAPAWTAISGLSAGLATTATNIAGGTAGQLHYQTAPGSTGFAGPGSAGQFLQSAGTSAPSYVGTSTMYVNRAVLADSATAATNATNVTSVTSSDDRIKSPNDDTASTMRFGFTSFANNNGAPWADYLHLRSYADATGGNDNLVMFRKDAIGMRLWQQTWGTSTAYTSYKDVAFTDSNITGAAAQVNTIAQPTAGVNYITFVDSNNATSTAETHYTTSTLFVNPGTQYVGMGAAVTPLARLHVVGAGTASLGAKRGGTSTGVFIEHNNNTDMYLELANSASYGSGVLFGKGSATGNYGLINYNNSTDALTFYTAAAVVKTIDSSGNHFLGAGSTQLNTGFTNKLNVSGSIVAGSATSTNGTTILQGQYGTGAITVLGTEYSSGGPVLGYGVYPSNAAAAAFFSSSGSALTRAAYTQAGNTHQWYVGASQTVAIGSTATLTNPMTLNANGLQALSLGVGTAPSGTTGEIRATNEITAYYSDRRLKENVKVIDNAVQKVLSLNGILYTPNELAESFGYDRTVKLVGLFADEVEAILPEATRPAPFDQDNDGNSKSGENYKTIQYEKLVPLLIEAIKEQQKQIAQLSEIVNTLVNK